MISESDFDLASKLGTKHYVPKILKKVKFAGGGGGDGIGEAVEGGDDGGDTYIAGDSPGPNTPVGRSRAPTAAADAEEAAPAPRARSQSRLRQSSAASTAPPSQQQPAAAPPPPRARSKSKGPTAKASGGSITGFNIRQNVGAATVALMRGASGAAAAVARAIPKPTTSAAGFLSPSGRSAPEMNVQPQDRPTRGRSPTPKPRNVIFMPGSTPPAAARAQSRGALRAASAASDRDGRQQPPPPHSPIREDKQDRKPPADELEIHAMKPVLKEASPPLKARLRRTQSQAPKAAAVAAPPLSLYGTLKGQNVIMGARGGLTVETATGGFRALSKAEKEQVVKKTA